MPDSPAPNTITIPILLAFVTSTALFSSLLTLALVWAIQRRRRLRHHGEQSHTQTSQSRTSHRHQQQQRKTLLPFLNTSSNSTAASSSPTTPPLQSSPLSSSDDLLHGNGNAHAAVSPLTPILSRGRDQQRRILSKWGLYEVSGRRTPTEMMGDTTWAKEFIGHSVGCRRGEGEEGDDGRVERLWRTG